ncbi:MFS transporter [Rhodohalobacter barkolensis]|uniref:MFS transporter n=1 Tax=Rhodohalobacter barkolensis TaxID=2053187 RepID=A0A2N0VKT7_9BACT|nr:MFS transporter [Rhodohalobacter barkolensis]PKD44771.1 MFS transporter [Rhodohalobacter barkolensis]
MSVTPKPRPKLSFWQIWNMSFGFLGIQFGFALQNANVSRIFETLGADIDAIPILWIAAPVTGLIIQPIIGYFSDRTWTRLGRRRPYFLYGAIAASAALIIMPNSPYLWVAAGMLWILDASINISMEPFRAYVGDMLPSEQRTKGFAMQSFFIGTGAVVASALPWMMTNWFGVANTAPEGVIPPSVKWSFYIGGAVFLAAVVWTVFRSHEYSPEELEAFEAYEDEQIGDSDEIKREVPIEAGAGQKKVNFGILFTLLGLAVTAGVYFGNYDPELYIITVGLVVLGVVSFLAGFIQRSGKTDQGLVVVVHDFLHMPKTMIQLAVVQFFSWFALFAMWIYTTAAVTAHIYGTSDTTSTLYNEGADWVGILFAVYNGFAAVIAFGLAPMAKATSRKVVHAIALVAGGLSLIGIYFMSSPNMLLISMLGIGFAWASILAMPYAILAGSLPAKKMGLYMGIFNFFIVIPQILAASLLGFATRNWFGGEAIYSLMLGGAAMIVAAATMYFVEDVDDPDEAVLP